MAFEDKIVSKQKVKFLTAIWGERYINEFSEVSLPSYLAPGNIPALAHSVDLEVLIMTTQDSLQVFDQTSSFRRLKEICPVRFILIDDLIADGVYGVTLTLAYARGIRSVGAEQTETYFVFMNSDFVLADGSLALLPSLMEQTPCIMAASLRGQAEPILEVLRQKVCPQSHQLAMPPREMVGLTLAHLHPTVLGKQVDQNTLYCATSNQLYWRVNDETLLGRSYLIFMLAIKPELPIGPVNSYCDYGFVPELVPSGRCHVIEDSDQFFMLEMQPAAQEADMLHLGRKTRAVMAKELQSWTTREHRNAAQHDTIFHSAELPPDINEFRKRANELVDDLARRMRPAKSHVNHRHWRMGLLAWWARRNGEPGAAVPFPVALERALLVRRGSPDAPLPYSFPEELLGPQPRLYGAGHRLLAHLRARRGIFPRVPWWHSRWADAQLLMDWVAETRRTGKTALIVDLGKGHIAQALEGENGVRTARALNLSPSVRSSLGLATASHLLICLPISGNTHDLDGQPATKQRLHELGAMIGEIVSSDSLDTSIGLFLYTEVDSLTAITPTAAAFNKFFFNISNPLVFRRSRVRFVGGRWRGLLLDLEIRLRSWSMAASGRGSPFALLAGSGWLVVCALLALMNKKLPNDGKLAEARTTSILLTL